MNSKPSDATLPFRTILAYGCGSFGNNLVYGLMSIYLMVFYTDQFGLPVASVGTLFLVARIWDAINDPIMGLLVDNTKSRWGQFRPYLLFVPLPMAIFTTLCFMSPEFSPAGKLIYAYFTYILWGMSFTAMDIPYWAMSAAMTEDSKERNKVVMIPRTLAAVAWTLIGMITLPMVAWLGSGDDRHGFLLTALAISIAAVAFTWITFFNCRENVHVKEERRQNLRDIIDMVIHNRPLRLVIGGFLMLEIVYAVKNILPIYYLTYVLHSKNLIPVFMGLNLALTLFGSIISPVLSFRFGKKRMAVWGNLIAALSGIAFYFAGYRSVIWLFIFNSILLITTSAANIALMSMLIDTVEYGEWKTGRRSGGIIFAMNTFKTKVAGAIGGALGAYGLAAIHYIPNVEQTEFTIKGMHLLFTLLPGALSLLAMLPFCFYDLTEERYDCILNELLERRKTSERQKG
ncbi:MAG: glycoside-pentoside-hexuronide (GPH):cation symporter [Kiritimatiellales bacterium]